MRARNRQDLLRATPSLENISSIDDIKHEMRHQDVVHPEDKNIHYALQQRKETLHKTQKAEVHRLEEEHFREKYHAWQFLSELVEVAPIEDKVEFRKQIDDVNKKLNNLSPNTVDAQMMNAHRIQRSELEWHHQEDLKALKYDIQRQKTLRTRQKTEQDWSDLVKKEVFPFQDQELLQDRSKTDSALKHAEQGEMTSQDAQKSDLKSRHQEEWKMLERDIQKGEILRTKQKVEISSLEEQHVTEKHGAWQALIEEYTFEETQTKEQIRQNSLGLNRHFNNLKWLGSPSAQKIQSMLDRQSRQKIDIRERHRQESQALKRDIQRQETLYRMQQDAFLTRKDQLPYYEQHENNASKRELNFREEETKRRTEKWATNSQSKTKETDNNEDSNLQ